MIRRSVLASLTLACCLTAPGRAAEPKPEPITRGQAEQILAGRDTIATTLDTWIKKEMKEMKEMTPSQKVILDDVRSVMAHSSEWRWYSRDHGILVAIPVRERLGIAAKVSGEKALEDVVRRLIYQNGWGNPPVQVVFIEPAVPCPVPRIPGLIAGSGAPCCSPGPAPVAPCGCH